MKKSPLIAAAALVLLLAAPASAASGPTIKVLDNRFDAKTTKVDIGDTVTWTFKGAVKHNVNGKGFTSKTQKKGTFTHTFNSAGSYEFHCTIHAGMKGKVVVS